MPKRNLEELKKQEQISKAIKGIFWLIVIGIIAYLLYPIVFEKTNFLLNAKDIVFVVNAGGHWYSCWSDASNLTVNYEMISTSPIDIVFTPTENDAKFLNETSKHYASCYLPSVLNYKGSCIINGEGCLVLFNKDFSKDTTINLKYSVERIK